MKNHTVLLTRTVLTSTLALVSLVVFAILVAQARPDTPQIVTEAVTQQAATSTISQNETETEAEMKEPTTVPEALVITTPKIEPEIPTQPQTTSQTQANVNITPKKFYDTPPVPLDIVNSATLPALVNILCASTPGSTIPGATGSGIIIDPRGVILTNAHVAQYALLENLDRPPVSCVVRTGTPARERYTARILAFPQSWVTKHAKDFLEEMPTGTGEHDWALLYITGTTNESPKPETFPFVSFDVREGVTATNDPVLLAGYPAGFLGSIALRRELWPVSTTTSVQKVFTFSKSLIDVLSLGGTIVAQGGSSGGAVVNQWNKLVGVIVTSSLGETTAERDLRAITLTHIDRSVKEHTGFDLPTFLQEGNFGSRVEIFEQNSAPYLLEAFPL